MKLRRLKLYLILHNSVYKEDAEKLGVTENEIALLRTLGYQTGTSYRENLEAAVAYFEELTNNDPHAMIGLAVFLNTFLVTLIQNWEIYPKNIESSDDNSKNKE